jgi:CDP-glucose 4,6-dehydratase
MENSTAMESLVMKQFADIYRDRSVLITGHTGFKGSWLSLWLTELGANVSGLALAPETTPNHWDLLGLEIHDHRIDVREAADVADLIAEVRPEIVFHMAAQPLVRRSYRNPLETWSTNVMGTANVLEACRKAPDVRAAIVITTDKVYENQEWTWGYRESDRIGGHDPYSASKAAAELLVDSYRKSFLNQPHELLLATTRAGNVIGGGDWSEARLIPDLIRAVNSGIPLEIRSPDASRPWQHVLDCLSGYLLLGQKLLEKKREYAEAWNFGPEIDANRKVTEVLTTLQQHWTELQWTVTAQLQPHETSMLYLDSAMAKARLGWQPVWSLRESLAATANWYHAFKTGNTSISRKQLTTFIEAANAKRVCWVEP